MLKITQCVKNGLLDYGIRDRQLYSTHYQKNDSFASNELKIIASARKERRGVAYYKYFNVAT